MALREVLGQAVVEIIGDTTQFDGEMSQVQKQVQGIGESLQTVGKTLSVGLTAPIVGFGAVAVKAFTGFEQSMSQVQALSGATGDELQRLRQVAIDLGAQTRFSATQAAQGMTLLSQAGFSVREVLQAMSGMLNLAAAAGTGLGEASQITANILAGFSLQANQAGRVADVLAAAANKSQTDVASMGLAMRDVAPIANNMGLSLEQVSAAIGVLSNAGIQGGIAGTALRNALLSLANPSKEATTTLNQLGIEIFDAKGQMMPLPAIVQSLANATRGLTQEQKAQALATIFGRDASSAMLALIQAGAGTLSNFTAELGRSQGAAQQMASVMQNNTAGSLEEFKGALETLQITVVSRLLPALSGLISGATNLVRWFSGLSPGAQNVAIALAAMAAAIGPLLIVAGTLIKTVSTLQVALAVLSGPIGAVIAVLALLTAAFIKAYTENQAFRNGVLSAWQFISATVIPIIKQLYTTISTVFAQITAVTKTNLGWIQAFWGTWGGTIVAITKGIFSLIQIIITTALKIIQGVVVAVLSALRGDWKGSLSAIQSINLSVWSAITATIRNFSSTIISIIRNLWSVVIGSTKSSWGGVPSFFSGIWSRVLGIFSSAASRIRGIVDSINNSIRGVTSAISALQTSANKVISGVSARVRSAASTVKSAIPGLARGGVIRQPGLTLVGERGPELLSLPRGAQVLPLSKTTNKGPIQLIQNMQAQASPSDLQRYTERALRRIATEWGIS